MAHNSSVNSRKGSRGEDGEDLPVSIRQVLRHCGQEYALVLAHYRYYTGG